MAKKYLDSTGLATLVNKIKALIPSKTSDLTNDSNYVKNTDYAASSKGGVVKVNDYYGFGVTNGGVPYVNAFTYENYVNNKDNNVFIGKGTLENVITGKQLTDKTYVDANVNKLLTAFGLDTDSYSSSSTYAVGDMVVYNNTIYECITAVTAAKQFDSSKWDIVPIIVNE